MLEMFYGQGVPPELLTDSAMNKPSVDQIDDEDRMKDPLVLVDIRVSSAMRDARAAGSLHTTAALSLTFSLFLLGHARARLLGSKTGQSLLSPSHWRAHSVTRTSHRRGVHTSLSQVSMQCAGLSHVRLPRVPPQTTTTSATFRLCALRACACLVVKRKCCTRAPRTSAAHGDTCARHVCIIGCSYAPCSCNYHSVNVIEH